MGLEDAAFASASWLFYTALLSCICSSLGFNHNSLIVILSVLLISWELGREYLMVSRAGKSVLVTGCDSGFGLSAAKYLSSQGYHVFAGVLYLEGEGARELCSTGKEIDVVKLDVTSERDVIDARSRIELVLRTRGLKLWGVVNNAGIFCLNLAELSPFQDYERVLLVNTLGTIRVTTAFVGLIRQSGGRVVNVSSFAGRMGTAFCAGYNASKYAIEGFSDALRYELAELGSKVVIVEPGNYGQATNIFKSEGTTFFPSVMKARVTEGTKDVYSDSFLEKAGRYVSVLVALGRKDTSPVINSIYAALTARYPRERYQPMGFLEKSLVILNELTPPCVLNVASRVYFSVCNKL